MRSVVIAVAGDQGHDAVNLDRVDERADRDLLRRIADEPITAELARQLCPD